MRPKTLESLLGPQAIVPLLEVDDERRAVTLARVLVESGLPVMEIALLCFGGIAMAALNESGRDRLYSDARTVRDRAGTVVYDPNHRSALWGEPNEAAAWMAKIALVASVVLASLDDGGSSSRRTRLGPSRSRCGRRVRARSSSPTARGHA